MPSSRNFTDRTKKLHLLRLHPFASRSCDRGQRVQFPAHFAHLKTTEHGIDGSVRSSGRLKIKIIAIVGRTT